MRHFIHSKKVELTYLFQIETLEPYIFSCWHNNQNVLKRVCSISLGRSEHNVKQSHSWLKRTCMSFDFISHWPYLVSQNNLLCPEQYSSQISETKIRAKYINVLIRPTNSYRTHSMCSFVLNSGDNILDKILSLRTSTLRF